MDAAAPRPLDGEPGGATTATIDGTVDVAVVGLGLVGSAALRHLAVGGVPVVGIGPAEPVVWRDHDGPFASHYDSGRITRLLDVRREWAVLAARAIAEYPVIEAAAATRFHWPVGVVMARRDRARLEAVTSVGRSLGVDFTVRPSDEAGAAAAFDERLAFPAGSTLIAEPGPGGFIDPRRMLAAQLAMATQHGARLVRDAATRIERGTDRRGQRHWVVRTQAGAVVRAGALIVACGPHTDELGGLPARPALRIRPEAVVLATLDEREAARLAGLPSVMVELDRPTYSDCYLVPPTNYPDGSIALKLGATNRSQPPLDTHDERVAWMAGDAHTAALGPLRALVEQIVPGIRARSWQTKPCLITDTASVLPMVDRLDDGLFIATGGNGYAAKSADAIGALAATLCRTGAWPDRELAAESFRFVAREPT
jgi:sarcosine oxidase